MSFARLLVAPSLASSALFLSSLRAPRTLHCDSSSSSSSLFPSSNIAVSLPKSTSAPLIDPHQFATGSILGLVSGMLLRRLGKLLFVVVGGTYLLLKALGTSSVPGLGQLRLGKVKELLLNRSSSSSSSSAGVGETAGERVLRFVKSDATFKVSYLTTFLIGLVNT